MQKPRFTFFSKVQIAGDVLFRAFHPWFREPINLVAVESSVSTIRSQVERMTLPNDIRGVDSDVAVPAGISDLLVTFNFKGRVIAWAERLF